MYYYTVHRIIPVIECVVFIYSMARLARRGARRHVVYREPWHALCCVSFIPRPWCTKGGGGEGGVRHATMAQNARKKSDNVRSI